MAKRGRPRHPDILTPREWEVLALLREGLTNEQIAERLDTTERTARYHVSEILSKLGVSTRQEAAAWQPEERPPWWLAAMAPLLSIKKGWIAATLVTALAIGGGAAAAVIVWGIARTDHNAPLATPVIVAPATQLAWYDTNTSDGSRLTATGSPACGDEATATTFGVPRMLEYTAPSQALHAVDMRLGLEAVPYDYVPAQVEPSPMLGPAGWELSIRNGYLQTRMTGPATLGPPEYFLRRLDKPELLFRYATDLCPQADGSPASGVPSLLNPPDTLQLPAQLPNVIIRRQGNYLSAEQTIEPYLRNQPPGVRPVWAELGNSGDFASTRGDKHFPALQQDPSQVVWEVVLALGDSGGPHRAGHEIGEYYEIDATTGQLLGYGCCLGLVFQP
jgi:DNA-binding CsgD family transcriptional regulator